MRKVAVRVSVPALVSLLAAARWPLATMFRAKDCVAVISGRPRRTVLRSLLVFLDDAPEIVSHLRNGLTTHLHFPILSTTYDNVEFGVARIPFGEIIAEVPAATLLPLQSGASDDLRDGHQILEIERRMPSRIVLAVSRHGNLVRPFAQRLERVQCASHLVLPSHNSDQL